MNTNDQLPQSKERGLASNERRADASAEVRLDRAVCKPLQSAVSNCPCDLPRSALEPRAGLRKSNTHFSQTVRAKILAATIIVGVCVLGAAGEPPGLGDRVVAFCKQHHGKRVGNGECTSLVEAALRAAGARRRDWRDRSRRDDELTADYVWGELIYVLERDGTNLKATGQIEDVRPGDIIQFRDVELAGPSDDGRYTMTAKHHTAVVSVVQDNGMVLKIYHQNYNGRKVVTADRLRLADLQQGRLRIYHPLPRRGSQPTDRPPLSARPLTSSSH